MIEQRLAERFQAAVADEPPLGFGPDELTDRAAHTHRRRKTVMGASAATVTVAAVAVAVAGFTAGPSSEPALVAAQPEVSKTSVTTASPLDGPEALLRKIQQVAPQVIGEHAAGQWADLGGWQTLERDRAMGAVVLYRTLDRHISVAVLRESRETGTLVSDTTNPDGSHSRVYRDANPAGEPQGLVVQHVQTNGVVIQVSGSLNVPQDTLVAIANDPRLTF